MSSYSVIPARLSFKRRKGYQVDFNGRGRSALVVVKVNVYAAKLEIFKAKCD